jgi:hypothetical protein
MLRIWLKAKSIECVFIAIGKAIRFDKGICWNGWLHRSSFVRGWFRRLFRHRQSDLIR